MYAQVVVLTYQSPDIDSYTYEVPQKFEESIKPGQIVQVPFGKRNPRGIILETRNQKPETVKTKPINSILSSQTILLSYQIAHDIKSSGQIILLKQSSNL